MADSAVADISVEPRQCRSTDEYGNEYAAAKDIYRREQSSVAVGTEKAAEGGDAYNG